MIVPMKRLRLIGLNHDREKLLGELMRLGCAELEDQAALLSDKSYAGLLERAQSDTSDIRSALHDLKLALDTLVKYAHPKKSMFALRDTLTEKELMNAKALQSAQNVSNAILDCQHEIAALNTEEVRLQNRRASLAPWAGLNIPLSATGTESCIIQLGVCPATANIDELLRLLPEQAPLSELFVVGSDREQYYVVLVCHVSQEPDAAVLLKSYGYSRMQFKDIDTSAGEAIAACDARVGEIAWRRNQLEQSICSHVGEQSLMERAVDALGIYLSRAEAAERTLSTDSCFHIKGWLEAPKQQEIEKVFGKYECAFELSAPDPEDERPPVKLKNSKFLEPFNMVTEMYSLPDYYNVDPNPLFSIFFAIFFGVMYADLGYGLVLVALGAFVSMKLKPRGMLGQMSRLLVIVGTSSALMGLIFGGFFSDSLKVVGKTFFNTDSWGIPPLWFDPLSDPLTLLIACLVAGAVQVLFGMAVKAYMLIRDGRLWDAVMDIGSWWLLFAGLAVVGLGGTPWVIYAGFAAIVLTQGRSSKSIIGKLVGGLGKLYDITAYLSDILSYCRLMALCMAGAVIGSVFNMLAGMLGGSGFIIGPILFTVMFVVGHVFNMAINIIGTYVHAARLQYLEFFGKFYEGGGRPFKPLRIDTKFVDIIKEEN